MATRRKKEWFDDDALWRELYPFMFPRHRIDGAGAEVGKVLALTRPKGQDALDLCCGPGRCSVALAQAGYSVTGVDRTRYLMDKARRRARTAKVSVHWVLQDMRDFVRPGSFDLVLSMFTSFGYFDDKREDQVVLDNMHSNLRPGGSCLLDVMGKERLARVFQPTTSELLPNGTKLVQRHEIFDDWSRIRNEWILIRKGTARSFIFHHTLYSGQELKDRLAQAGFCRIKLYGNLDGDAYGPNANRLIAVASKAARSARRAKP